MKIVVTGANSSVGRNLLSHVAGAADLDALALVRSEAAAAPLPRASNIHGRVLGYGGEPVLGEAMEGAQCAVHLAGILIESRAGSYRTANVEATAAVVRAAEKAGVPFLIFVSVVGADPASANPYHRSKGEAERLVAAGRFRSAILRTPMLLGPGTAGARALLHAASRSRARLLGGGRYLMRPLDVDDLSAAILRLCRQPPVQSAIFELAGPETLSYRQLVERAAAGLGKSVRLGTAPIGPAKALAALTFRLRGGGISPAVIDVITMNESVAGNADAALGITLTPLDETLAKLVNRQPGGE